MPHDYAASLPSPRSTIRRTISLSDTPSSSAKRSSRFRMSSLNARPTRALTASRLLFFGRPGRRFAFIICLNYNRHRRDCNSFIRKSFVCAMYYFATCGGHNGYERKKIFRWGCCENEKPPALAESAAGSVLRLDCVKRNATDALFYKL
jgi:hypothetical protein